LYIPAWFREDDITSLHDLMRAYSFATLVTEAEGAPFATHLPILLDADRGRFGILRGHVARPNPQWRAFTEGRPALVIFQGPHAYVSPSWYETSPAVPTWNYAVVHAYGTPRCVEESDLRDILTATLEEFEQPGASIALPEEYFDRMMHGVVGFEMEITRLEGKLKLSQNRSVEDRQRVIRALEASPRETEREVATLMRERETAGPEEK